jgi:hypothetical protein
MWLGFGPARNDVIHRVGSGGAVVAGEGEGRRVRLKKLRLAVRGVRLRACRTVQRHLRSLRRLLVPA